MRPQSNQRKKRESIQLGYEDKGFFHLIARAGLKIFGLWDKTQANARNISLMSVEFGFSNLPESFDGVKILFMSDLHFPGFDGFNEKLEELISPLDFDYCFLGGDYSNGTGALPEKVTPCLERLIRLLLTKTPDIYSVLGNHDVYNTAVLLEKSGVNVLINDSCIIQRDAQQLCVVGLDDHYHYRDTDWQLAEENVEAGCGFKILLSHSPDNYRKAAAKGYDLMLSGHTHGGQLCLPGRIPVVTHSKARGKFAKGPWDYKRLQGYTTYGTGTSAMGARLYSPPEICLITLRKTTNSH